MRLRRMETDYLWIKIKDIGNSTMWFKQIGTNIPQIRWNHK